MTTSTVAPSSSPSGSAIHPFANTTSLLEIIPNGIDIEEEVRLYEELCYDEDNEAFDPRLRPDSPPAPPSVFSREIYLDDHSGESMAFAREVQIAGWTNVGDKRGGAYIVYDCAIRTKEGSVMHVLKRYSDFLDLDDALRRTLPRSQHRLIPLLPPKAPFARYRPAFLDRRRRLLQFWLTSILLHPDIGACKAVRVWVMN